MENPPAGEMMEIEEFPLTTEIPIIDPSHASRRVERSPLDLFLKELYANKSE